MKSRDFSRGAPLARLDGLQGSLKCRIKTHSCLFLPFARLLLGLSRREGRPFRRRAGGAFLTAAAALCRRAGSRHAGRGGLQRGHARYCAASLGETAVGRGPLGAVRIPGRDAGESRGAGVARPVAFRMRQGLHCVAT